MQHYVGRVTAGEFSLSRGKCHGIAILGAARLLKALEKRMAPGGQVGCIVRRSNGFREVQISATAQTFDGAMFRVSISLIL